MTRMRQTMTRMRQAMKSAVGVRAREGAGDEHIMMIIRDLNGFKEMDEQ